MSFYDSMANGVSGRAGAFVTVILIVTGIMFIAFGTMEQTYDATRSVPPSRPGRSSGRTSPQPHTRYPT
ncbi:MAG: hypothetical protein GWN18_03380 [Thermoplasmata archaeon]|nr:hypothetical protein [Thermoplasmata archaeon]NIW81626.1 hypothetical protein [Thermoplasmata archaeon]NIY02422.1 hypothetical protein [Thermoplasmata archaeon]